MDKDLRSMAIDPTTSGRQAVIAQAITSELENQAHDGTTSVDVDALAAAIDKALEGHTPASEGKRPEDLNATNDD